jgi:Ion channel
MSLALTIALSLATIFTTVFAHYETLEWLARTTRRRPGFKRTTLFVAISGLVAAHLAEIALFAAAFYFAVKVLNLGTFVEPRSMGLGDYFYYAAETYSSLGYGDIYPLGQIRLLASVTPLIGILLLGWSAAFLFSLVERHSIEPPR